MCSATQNLFAEKKPTNFSYDIAEREIFTCGVADRSRAPRCFFFSSFLLLLNRLRFGYTTYYSLTPRVAKANVDLDLVIFGRGFCLWRETMRNVCSCFLSARLNTRWRIRRENACQKLKQKYLSFVYAAGFFEQMKTYNHYPDMKSADTQHFVCRTLNQRQQNVWEIGFWSMEILNVFFKIVHLKTCPK